MARNQQPAMSPLRFKEIISRMKSGWQAFSEYLTEWIVSTYGRSHERIKHCVADEEEWYAIGKSLIVSISKNGKLLTSQPSDFPTLPSMPDVDVNVDLNQEIISTLLDNIENIILYHILNTVFISSCPSEVIDNWSMYVADSSDDLFLHNKDAYLPGGHEEVFGDGIKLTTNNYPFALPETIEDKYIHIPNNCKNILALSWHGYMSPDRRLECFWRMVIEDIRPTIIKFQQIYNSFQDNKIVTYEDRELINYFLALCTLSGGASYDKNGKLLQNYGVKPRVYTFDESWIGSTIEFEMRNVSLGILTVCAYEIAQAIGQPIKKQRFSKAMKDAILELLKQDKKNKGKGFDGTGLVIKLEETGIDISAATNDLANSRSKVSHAITALRNEGWEISRNPYKLKSTRNKR